AGQRLGHFQIPARGGVETYIFARAFSGDGRDVDERLALRLASVFEQRTAGANGERQVFAAVAGEARAAELLQKPALAALDVEVPRRQPGEEVAVEHHAVGDQHFGRRDA